MSHAIYEINKDWLKGKIRWCNRQDSWSSSRVNSKAAVMTYNLFKPLSHPHTSIKFQLLMVHFPITPSAHLCETPPASAPGRTRTCTSTSVVTTSQGPTHCTNNPSSTCTSSLGTFHFKLQSFIRFKPKRNQDSNPQPQNYKPGIYQPEPPDLTDTLCLFHISLFWTSIPEKK